MDGRCAVVNQRQPKSIELPLRLMVTSLPDSEILLAAGRAAPSRKCRPSSPRPEH